jgi:transcriptional regulator with XRE-family HTH domain
MADNLALLRAMKSLHVSQEELAARIREDGRDTCGCNRAMVYRWIHGVSWPQPRYVRALARVTGMSAAELGFEPDREEDQRSVSGNLSGPESAVPGGINTEDARSVLAWIETTNTSDDVISYFDHAIKETAREHASLPPAVLLAKVQPLHGMIQVLLRSGKQRFRQTRELLRLDADLLAHTGQLLGDVHRDEAAFACAAASVGLAEEAGSSAAAAFSAQAQMARWRGRYALAADLAARGLGNNPPAGLRTLLAYQEADAAAASGHMPGRARAALERAESTDDDVTFYSAWSCPPARRALFRMGVPLNLGQPHEALRLAAEAEPMWQTEWSRAFGTWAHFRIAVAKAHILAGSVEGATEQVRPVLDLPQEYHISTLTGHFTTLNALLTDRRFSKSHEAASLRELLRGFREDG